MPNSSNHVNLQYHGDIKADVRFQDGALPHAMGVKHYQVMRSTRSLAHASGQVDWTYNHAPMLAWWNNHFYISYLSNPISEHEAPGSVFITRSLDGKHWDSLSSLFPPIAIASEPYRGPKKELLDPIASVVMHHRMSFYVSTSGKLLATTFYGFSPDGHMAPNNGWGVGRVVREVYEDFSFSPIYFLRYNSPSGYNQENTTIHPYFRDSSSAEFVDACNELLNHRLATQQWWEEEKQDESGLFTLTKLRAPSLYTAEDNSTLAVGKDAITSCSYDKGESWSPPQRDSTIETGGGKVWGQKTSDGRFALVYNPTTDSAHRWPLAIVSGENGRDFDSLLALTPEIPPCRYAGYLKNLGAQYVRGIPEYNPSPQDNNLWLTYSINKEDIWVCSVPLPVTSIETNRVSDHFAQSNAPLSSWNLSIPKWANVQHSTIQQALSIQDWDRYHRVIAQRSFPTQQKGVLQTKIKVVSNNEYSALLLSLQNVEGRTPLKISFQNDNFIYLMNGGRWHQIAPYQSNKWYDIKIQFDCIQNKGLFVVVNEESILVEKEVLYSQSVHTLERIRFTSKLTLPFQTIADTGNTLSLGDLPGGEEPTTPSEFHIASLHTTSSTVF